MAQQNYGAAQPIAAWAKTYVFSPAEKALGMINKFPPKDGSSTNVGKLPPAWEEANRKSVAAQLKGTQLKSRASSGRKVSRKRKSTKSNRGK